MGCTYDADQTSLDGHILTCPSEIPVVEAERAVFGVPTAGTDGMDALGTELRASGLTAKLEFSLFAVMWTLSTRGGALVARGARDT
jgi:hypothetical protein